MKKSGRILAVSFAALMIVFVSFMVWYLPSAASLRSQLVDIENSLETSRGRERKQSYEYDRVTEKIPLVRAELEEFLPLLREAEDRVSALKAEKKDLKGKKKDLEALILSVQEEQSHD